MKREASLFSLSECQDGKRRGVSVGLSQDQALAPGGRGGIPESGTTRCASVLAALECIHVVGRIAALPGSVFSGILVPDKDIQQFPGGILEKDGSA